MKTYRKKKLEMVIESALLPRALEMLREEGATGWTVVPQVSGSGRHGARDEAHVSDVFRNVHVFAITGEATAQRILERSQELLEGFTGIVFLSDVEVLRDEHF